MECKEGWSEGKAVFKGMFSYREGTGKESLNVRKGGMKGKLCSREGRHEGKGRVRKDGI